MKQERTLSIEGKEYTLLISDEPQALLEAKASGRAVLGCLDTGNGEGASRDFQGIPYVVPSMEYVTEELLEKMDIKITEDGCLEVPVVTEIPPFLMGSGVGSSTAFSGDYDILTGMAKV